MAKKETKVYICTDEEREAMVQCIKNDIAFCIQPCYNMSTNHWIVRYKPSNYKKTSFLRIDTSIPDKENNRVKLNHYDACKKIFELYVQYSKQLNK